MKAYAGYQAKKSAAREQLPVGGYVAKILDAKEQTYSWGSVLLISFDIIEGEYKDFFKKDYQSQATENQKWRGVYRLNIPKDDGSEKDAWTKRSFEHTMWVIETDNPGYNWAWDEATLKNKLFGVVFRNYEWVLDDGKSGMSTEVGICVSINDIRAGNFRIPKDRLKNNKKSAATPQNSMDISADDFDDLPFTF